MPSSWNLTSPANILQNVRLKDNMLKTIHKGSLLIGDQKCVGEKCVER